jgi:hypothetical protein
MIQRPAYWRYLKHGGFSLFDENEHVCAAVETLMNETAQPDTHGVGRDSHKQRFSRFKVVSVQRVENPQAWTAYAGSRRALAEDLSREGYVPPAMPPLETASFCYPLQYNTLEQDAGEVFLFHGTPKATSISRAGFDVRYAMAGSGAGDLFGKGVYFAESASKADQYVPVAEPGAPQTMVLARVTLGRCQVVRRTRSGAPFLPEVKGRSTADVPVYYDSIVADVSRMRFREIIVGKDTCAYPELLVTYMREPWPSGDPWCALS